MSGADTGRSAMPIPADEWAALRWSLLYFFCLLTGYYLLRPVRDAMGASGDLEAIFPSAWIAWLAVHDIRLGDFTLQVLFTGTFLCMVLLQPVYGVLVSRFPRRVFLPAIYLLFVCCLLLFHWAFRHEVSGRGAVFFVWTAVFNLFAVSVFWSYMADIYDNVGAKRFYGYIGAGGTVGAVSGPLLTRSLAQWLGIGNLLLASAVFLLICVFCILRLRPAARRRELQRDPGSERAMGGSIWGGLKLVACDPLLRALALLLFFGVGIGTFLYNEQARIARHFFISDEARTTYYANIDLAVNGVTIVIQLFLTRWLLGRFGIAPLLLAPALAVLAGFSLLTASPLPVLVAIVQVMARSSEFSLAKPARETLYTRMSPEARYKAKAAIDTVVYRGGDLGFVWLHKWLSLFGSRMVFAAGVAVAAGMTFSAWRVIRAQRTLPEHESTRSGDSSNDKSP